jgi:hypothetical protein
MILTSGQHRGVAKLLRRNARNLPEAKRGLAHKMAGMHVRLARAQDNDPLLAPKNDPNQPLPKSPSPSLAPSLPGERPNN